MYIELGSTSTGEIQQDRRRGRPDVVASSHRYTMARKKKSHGRRSSPDEDSKASRREKRVSEQRDKELADLWEQVHLNSELPRSALAKKIRVGLRWHGTNVVQNDNDPMGDGDQSVIEGERHRQFHRELFATGGDTFNCVRPVNTMSPFACAVLTGNVREVEDMLKKAEDAAAAYTAAYDGEPSPALVALLETRETSLRLSPILMIVAMGKNFNMPKVGGLDREMDEAQIAVAKVLLKYGARPDARDVVGKTVFHYGAGVFATSMTLGVADLCLRAQEGGSHLFGKPVTLVSMSNEAMNGQRGIALGFDVDTGLRFVSLPDGDSRNIVAVKPENLRLNTDARGRLPEEAESRPLVRLCDIQDRLGEVSFLEVIYQGRVDVANFLLERRVRLDVVNSDGVSPLSMAMDPGAQYPSEVCRLINEHAASTVCRDRRKKCSCCGKNQKDTSTGCLDLCAGCKMMRYCSKECQLRHWKASHKVECRAIQAKKKERVVLDRPPTCTGFTSFHPDAPQISDEASCRMPRGVQAGEKFTIKVQASGTREAGSLHIYNKARDCSFLLRPGQAGFTELFDVVKAEQATNGTQTYMKALFDEEGNCVAFPGDTHIHTW